MPRWNMTPEDRFFDSIELDPSDDLGCFLWRAAIQSEGYGTIWVDGKRQYAHRYSYQRVYGDIAPGLVLDHLCRKRACIHPDHMEPVSNQENILRGTGATAQNAAAIACPQGHPYDAENTMHCNGHRRCKECNRIRARAHYYKSKEQGNEHA